MRKRPKKSQVQCSSGNALTCCSASFCANFPRQYWIRTQYLWPPRRQHSHQLQRLKITQTINRTVKVAILNLPRSAPNKQCLLSTTNYVFRRSDQLQLKTNKLFLPVKIAVSLFVSVWTRKYFWGQVWIYDPIGYIGYTKKTWTKGLDSRLDKKGLRNNFFIWNFRTGLRFRIENIVTRMRWDFRSCEFLRCRVCEIHTCTGYKLDIPYNINILMWVRSNSNKIIKKLNRLPISNVHWHISISVSCIFH